MALLTFYYTNYLIHVDEENPGFFYGNPIEVTFRVLIVIVSIYLGTIELIQAVTVPFRTYIKSVSNLNYVFMLVLNLLVLIMHSNIYWD
jgi:hypothetical protein